MYSFDLADTKAEAEEYKPIVLSACRKVVSLLIEYF